MDTKPVESVKALFAAFGRGDVPGVLAMLDDDVDWGGGKADVDVPTQQPRHGRKQVGEFFEAVGREQEFHRFEPRRFFAEGNDVLVLVREEFAFRRTGRRVDIDVVHHFTLNGAGKVARYVSYYDTARYAAAYRGAAAAR
jgi:ketosteroid isomerase-like protein